MHDVSSSSRAVVGASTDGVHARSNLRVLVRLRTSALARDVVLASAVSLVLGLIRLGAPSFWEDEAFTWAEMQYSLAKKLDVQLHFLHLVLIEPWAALAGTSEWALRFPSVVGAMVSVGLLVVLANKLFDRRVALVSGLLLATSPFFVKWSQQARAYSMFVALCLIAMLLLLRAFERNSRGAWAVFGLALSAVIVWHPVSGCLVLPAYAVFIVQRRDRFLPHGLLSAVDRRDPRGALGGDDRDAIEGPDGLDRLPDTRGRGTRGARRLGGGRARPALGGASGSGCSAAPAVRILAVWLGAWAVCPFVLALLVSFFQPMFLDRFLIATAPAFAMLAAVGLLGVRRRLRWARRSCRRARHGDRPCPVVRAKGQVATGAERTGGRRRTPSSR